MDNIVFAYPVLSWTFSPPLLAAHFFAKRVEWSRGITTLGTTKESVPTNPVLSIPNDDCWKSKSINTVESGLLLLTISFGCWVSYQLRQRHTKGNSLKPLNCSPIPQLSLFLFLILKWQSKLHTIRHIIISDLHIYIYSILSEGKESLGARKENNQTHYFLS